ncbi:hypothetical protein J3458_005621 [Metarhizium acridum]|uniref:uncharacterized protein n=1 Tax=Metarhizium acridum TaxID=92637 RepID=UPI001C6AFA10|nr:hypothetical protein J3458_005621 [Metarhizium acridum]
MLGSRRKEAWYLSTLCVHPVYQGQRLGRAPAQEGLELVDEAGSASYLVGLRSVGAFYPKYGLGGWECHVSGVG